MAARRRPFTEVAASDKTSPHAPLPKRTAIVYRNPNRSSTATVTTANPASQTGSSSTNNQVQLGQHLTCTMCLQPFKMPKNMPSCPHTFCLECLSRLPKTASTTAGNNSQSTVQCPRCHMANVIGSCGVEGLQTNFVVQSALEEIQRSSSQSSVQQQQPNGDVANDSCRHLASNTSGHSTCPHCNRDFCLVCASSHLENVKKSTLLLADQVLTRCEGLHKERLIADLKKAADMSVALAESNIDAAASLIRANFEMCLSKKVAALKSHFQELKTQSLDLPQSLIIERIADSSYLNTMKAIRNEVASPISLIRDMSTVAKFFGALKTFELLLGPVKTLSEKLQSNSPLFQFASNPANIAKFTETIDSNLSLGSVISLTLGIQSKQQVLPELCNTMQILNSLKQQAEQPRTITIIPPPLRSDINNLSGSISLDELEDLASDKSLSDDDQVGESVMEMLEEISDDDDDNPNLLRNVKAITASKTKNTFIVVSGDKKMTVIDKFGKLMSEVELSKSAAASKWPCPSSIGLCSLTCSETNVIYCGARFTTAAMSSLGSSLSSYHPAENALGHVNLEKANNAKVEWLNSYISDTVSFQGVAVVNEWRTVFRATGSDLTATHPFDASSTGVAPMNYPVGKIGSNLYLHGVLRLDDPHACRLICSINSGQLIRVKVTWRPKNKMKKFVFEAMTDVYVIPLDGFTLTPKSAAYLVHKENKLFVLTGNVLKVFNVGYSMPGFSCEFKFPEKIKCRSIAVLSDKMSQATVAVTTPSGKVKIFEVPLMA